MKIIVVGASGTLGQAVVKELGARHELVRVGRTSGDVKADLTKPDSIRELYRRVGKVDAVVCTAGKVHFAPLDAMTAEHFRIGLDDKLMGQVNLVMLGRDHVVVDGGSFTLISGILANEPIVAGSSASMVSGALESFTRAAAIELPRGQRLNCVSPTVFQESMADYGPFFRGFEAVPVARAALAYSRSVEGRQTGQIYRVG